MVGRAPRVLAYSHDGYGLGHIRRNLRVTRGLLAERPDLQVLAVTGCKVAHKFRYPPGIEYLKLPPVTKISNDLYVADGLEIPGAEVRSLRASLIAGAVERFEPDLVLVDRHPLGLNGELAEGLRTLLDRRPSARLVLGLRDIIDRPETVRSEWREKGLLEVIERLYESVLVYGSCAVYDPIREYQLPPAVTARLQFVGYLAHDAPLLPNHEIRQQLSLRDGARLALCTLGGGKDAAHVASAFLEAMGQLRDGWQGLLVTGPYMSEEDHASLTSRGAEEAVVIRRFVSDLPSHLAAADAVLCMGGYNTLCEVLSVGAAAVVVPRVRPRVEQLIRAHAFAARGLVRVIHPGALAAGVVARELLAVSEEDPARRLRAFDALGRGGVREAAAHLARLLSDDSPSTARHPPRERVVTG